jgi:Glycosyl transferase family 2
MSVPQANLPSSLSAERDSLSALHSFQKGSGRLLAPIALFVYNRPEHTRRTLETLLANDLAQQSDLLVFADGPKNESVASAVEAVRKCIRKIDGFKSVTIIERERNLGLSKSVISGVTQLCNEYGRAIAVEDDVLTAPDFLTFINSALERYADEPKMFSVCASNPPIVTPKTYSYDAFCSYRFMCWGWGTWKDRWEKADWSVKDFPEFKADREKQRRFNRGGDDLSWFLAQHIESRVDSWDTVWAYTHSKHDAVALLPVSSKVYNIGFDGTGIHCRRAPFKQNALATEGGTKCRFPESIIPEPYYAKQIQRLHHRSISRKFARYLYDKIGLR